MGSITIHDNGSVVQATAVPPAAQGETWSWSFRATDTAVSRTAINETDEALSDRGQYAGQQVQARLKRTDGSVDESTFFLVPPDLEESDGSAKLDFHGDFGLGLAVVIAVVSFALGWSGHIVQRLRESTAVGTTLETLPGQLAWPLLAAGWMVLSLGLWMLAMEWRAGFKASKAAPVSKGDLPAVIEALGKLKGATLVAIIGLVLLLAPAWIAGSTAASDGSGGSGDDSAVTTAP
ncbi:hypothetical protein [Ornithinimicrobium tianjinense]|uniref:Uncharacterized protein n=1 Tax=Ornithinimicrobium tianjinense TaxID=1195761 RepID=A0A917FAZ4_9MICO|nr:hypothetical protein [Ornithinimicrobium tianjinense]GGF58700.1 hypothetical protein GCM10011366_28170 [Ornithinimicrobium tianjinense]